MNDAALILTHYLQQEPDLLDGHTDPTKIVPYWFYNLNEPEKFTVPRPEYVGPRTPEVMARIAAWVKDPCFDLSCPRIDEDFNDVEIEGLTYYEKAVKQWQYERRQWDIGQELTILRKWIYWLSRFTNMNLMDWQVMKMGGLIPQVDE